MDTDTKLHIKLNKEINSLKNQIKSLKKQLSESKKQNSLKPSRIKSKKKNNLDPGKLFSERLENYKTIVSSLSEGIVMQDASGKIIASNKSAEHILGLTKSQMIGRTSIDPRWKAIHQDGSPFPGETHPSMVTLATGKKCQNVIMGVHKPDGSLIWISINSIPLKESKGKNVLGVVTSFTDISERISTEKELLKSEEKHKIISSISSDYIYSVNMQDLTLEWASGAFTEITGYTIEEINKLPQKWISVLHPDDAKPVSEKIIKDIQARKIPSYEIRIVRKDGKIRWINDKISALYENDKPVRLYGAVQDITKRKQAETTLLESEKQLSVIFDNSSDMQILFSVGVDSDFRVVNVNNTCIKELQKTNKNIDETKILGKSIYDVFNKTFKIEDEKYNIILGHFFQTIATSSQIEYDISYFHNNEEFHSEVVLTPIIGKENICVYIHWSSRNVTFRNKALNAIRESEEKYRKLIDQSNDAIFLFYQDSFELTNIKFRKLFGISQKEISKPKFNFFQLVSPKSRNFILDQYQKLQKNENPALNFQFYGLTTDRKEILIEAVITEIEYKDGIAIQGILRDITERTRMEEELRQSQKMEAVGRLAGGIAHDFNNLLTIINGYCDLLLLKPLSAEIQQPLKAIIDASTRASGLTSQLLAFSRKQVIKPVVINLNNILQKQIEMLRRLIGENIDIKMMLGDELSNIKADPGQIEQIIMNITINARDAMPKGGILAIHTKNVVFNRNDVLEFPGAKTGQYVLLSISDSGMGMDDKIVSRIFEPFFSTKEKDKGTGLGLATVYGIVKQNNGFIYVFSKPKKGTTFRIYLPLVKEKAANLKKVTVEYEDLQGDETILLVEDDLSVREVTRSTLVGYGYNVILAADGKEALRLFKNHINEIKLLLTDVVMPVMSGKDLAEKLCKLNPKLKIIFFSGYLDNSIIDQQINGEDPEFIQKPYTHAEIARKIKEVLKN